MIERGRALQAAGRAAEAVKAFSKATALFPGDAAAHLHLGDALQAGQRFAEAATAFAEAVRLQPRNAAAHRSLGIALLSGGNPERAFLALVAAGEQEPDHAAGYILQGHALLAMGRADLAAGAFLTASQLDPGNADTQAEAAGALHGMGRHQEALGPCLKALQLDMGHVAAAANFGAVLVSLCDYQRALNACDHTLVLDPGHWQSHLNRSLALEGLGRFAEARDAARRAAAIAPGNPAALHNLAVLLLASGELTDEAWRLYEARFELKGSVLQRFAGLRWNGEEAAGRTILLHCEQGLGDTLQFVRYAPLVAARAGRVILVVQPSLARLLRSVPGVDQVVAAGTKLPPFDLFCPLLSLPGIFATHLGSIPPALPYHDAFEPWDDGAAGLRVGLAWAGNANFVHDRQRSLAPADLAGLAGIPGVQFYSLQRHDGVPVPLPSGLQAVDLMPGVLDFADTAERVAGLDLIIAADTAVAHLAATLGKPVWLLSRFRGCWRWLHGGDASSWYPNLRLVRQDQPNNWRGAIQRIREDLAALASRPPVRPPASVRKPGRALSRPCKACGLEAGLLGAVDFNKSCEDRRRVASPLSGRLVAYYRCAACSLMFTGDFDAWSQDDFRQRIYNAGYAEADPDYAGARPALCSDLIAELFGDVCSGLDVLDYGGGGGALAALLRRDHGMAADVYDPFSRGHDTPPGRAYPLVTCFEVLEHTPDPRATIREIAGLVQPDGMVVFSTLLQSPSSRQQGVDWWYAAPRNGHVTLYSVDALRMLWEEAGFTLITDGNNLHMAFRRVPPFAPEKVRRMMVAGRV